MKNVMRQSWLTEIDIDFHGEKGYLSLLLNPTGNMDQPMGWYDLLKFGGVKASTEILRLLVACRAFCQLVKLVEKKVIADDYNYAVAA